MDSWRESEQSQLLFRPDEERIVYQMVPKWTTAQGNQEVNELGNGQEMVIVDPIVQ